MLALELNKTCPHYLTISALVFGGVYVSILWYFLQRSRGQDVNYLRTRLVWAENCSDTTLLASYSPTLGLAEWRDSPKREKVRNELIAKLVSTSSVSTDRYQKLLKPDPT